MAWERIYPWRRTRIIDSFECRRGVFFPRRVYLDIGHPTIRKKHFFLFVFIGAIQQLKQKNIETRPGFEVISATGSV